MRFSAVLVPSENAIGDEVIKSSVNKLLESTDSPLLNIFMLSSLRFTYGDIIFLTFIKNVITSVIQ